MAYETIEGAAKAFGMALEIQSRKSVVKMAFSTRQERQTAFRLEIFEGSVGPVAMHGMARDAQRLGLHKYTAFKLYSCSICMFK